MRAKTFSGGALIVIERWTWNVLDLVAAKARTAAITTTRIIIILRITDPRLLQIPEPSLDTKLILLPAIKVFAEIDELQDHCRKPGDFPADNCRWHRGDLAWR